MRSEDVASVHWVIDCDMGIHILIGVKCLELKHKMHEIVTDLSIIYSLIFRWFLPLIRIKLVTLAGKLNCGGIQ